jgi:hypothetical protein
MDFFSPSANTPSQAHLQGTQSRYTKANLAKEPALFLRFQWTPLLLLDTEFQVRHPTEGRTYNIGLGKMQAEGNRVSAFVSQFGCISSSTLYIELWKNHQHFSLNSAAVSRG